MKPFKILATSLFVLCLGPSTPAAQQGAQASLAEQSEIVQRILGRLDEYGEARLLDNGRLLALSATIDATESVPSRPQPSRRIDYQVGTLEDQPVFVPFKVSETLDEQQAEAVLQKAVSQKRFTDFLRSRMGRAITQYQACDARRVCVRYCKRKDETKYCCRYECQ